MTFHLERMWLHRARWTNEPLIQFEGWRHLKRRDIQEKTGDCRHSLSMDRFVGKTSLKDLKKAKKTSTRGWSLELEPWHWTAAESHSLARWVTSPPLQLTVPLCKPPQLFPVWRHLKETRQYSEQPRHSEFLWHRWRTSAVVSTIDQVLSISPSPPHGTSAPFDFCFMWIKDQRFP